VIAVLVAMAWAAASLSAVGLVAVPPDARCPPRRELAKAVAARIPDELAGWVARYRVQLLALVGFARAFSH
jgi:hypothetical protein